MAVSNSVECNRFIDQVIESRRSIRKFKSETPSRDLVELVLQAGSPAPYAGASVSREDFRRFVVIPRESSATGQIAALLKRKAESWASSWNCKCSMTSLLGSVVERFLERLKMMGEYGAPNVGKAPYYIVVAEERGIPPVEQLSLAHCLENMWLKAAALGLGLQLLSITEQMASDREFCELIKIPVGEFALDGCVLGYPDMKPGVPKRPILSQVTQWII